MRHGAAGSDRIQCVGVYRWQAVGVEPHDAVADMPLRFTAIGAGSIRSESMQRTQGLLEIHPCKVLYTVLVRRVPQFWLDDPVVWMPRT